ncbi:hypothetical protein VTI74DRAFT_11503 [Chaetomium olivicolor]
MEKLPVELVHRICWHLCPHCQDPESICAIGQPFVFHYYATGNLPDISAHPLKGYQYSEDARPIAPIFHLFNNNNNNFNFNKLNTQILNFPYTWSQSTVTTLEQLAILSCPNVKTLLTMQYFSLFTYNYITDSNPRTLPALKTIGLLSSSSGYHYASTSKILALAPNLETVYGAQLTSTAAHGTYRPSSWKRAFPTVRKLVVHDLGLQGLSSLAASFPDLHELRYTHSVDPVDSAPLDVPSESRFDSSGNFFPVESFYGFPKLGEQRPGQIVLVLPQSIVNLHITHAFPLAVLKDLEFLAEEAATSQPNLKSVKVSIEDHPDARNAVDQQTKDDLVGFFAKHGLMLSWGVSRRDDEMWDIPGLPIVDVVGDYDQDDEDSE